jgi:hypothetical protein|tara:strand:- start:490 stop:657 length:168 start_codon:yes stop_codon:yes gene_type:complete
MVMGGRLFKDGDILECESDEGTALISSGLWATVETPKPKKPKKASSKSQNETEEK